jgi:cell division protein FtsZ
LIAIGGSDDLGMLEVQDAAKIITESIDPNARVIFGAFKDEKLKKNEIKVTVIATGFPETGPSRSSSLFTSFRDEVKNMNDDRGAIHNALDIPAVKPIAKEEPIEKKEEVKPIDDDDDWGAVPAFLRRSKIK